MRGYVMGDGPQRRVYVALLWNLTRGLGNGLNQITLFRGNTRLEKFHIHFVECADHASR